MWGSLAGGRRHLWLLYIITLTPSHTSKRPCSQQLVCFLPHGAQLTTWGRPSFRFTQPTARSNVWRACRDAKPTFMTVQHAPGDAPLPPSVKKKTSIPPLPSLHPTHQPLLLSPPSPFARLSPTAVLRPPLTPPSFFVQVRGAWHRVTYHS